MWTTNKVNDLVNKYLKSLIKDTALILPQSQAPVL